jgi:hypothetical protein
VTTSARFAKYASGAGTASTNTLSLFTGNDELSDVTVVQPLPEKIVSYGISGVSTRVRADRGNQACSRPRTGAA